MDWLEFFKLLGLTSAFQIILLLFVGYLIKNSIDRHFTETVEIKKAELSQNIEAFKLKLDHENKLQQQEFQIQFSELHLKRTEIVSVMYSQLIELHSDILKLTARVKMVQSNAEKEEEERINNANESFLKFSRHFQKNKIYFAKGIADKLENINKIFWSNVWDYSYIHGRLKDKNLPNSSWREFFDEQIRISESMRTEIPPILEDLENEFRSLLGVN